MHPEPQHEFAPDRPSPPPRTASTISTVLMVLTPALLFLGIYLPSLDHDFVWTDQGEIEVGLLILPPEEIATAFERPMLSGLAGLEPGLAAPYYRPMQVIAASVIDDRLGREPRNFRALNLALGAATSALVALLAWLLLRHRGAAAFAGAIYAVHPANIENYVWIAGLSHALAAFWMVVSLIFGLLALRAHETSRFTAATVASAVAMLLALLSKENAAATVLLMLALAISTVVAQRRVAAVGESDSAPVDEGSRAMILRAAVLLVVQLFLTALFVGVWRPAVLGAVLAEASPLHGSWSVQISSALGSWSDTIGWLVLPAQSTTSDVIRLIGSPLHPRALLGALLAGLSLALWLRWLREGHVIAALGLAWIWIAFAPTSGLVPLNHMRGERYVSLSLLGLALLIPALLTQVGSRLADRTRQALVIGVALLVTLGLASLSVKRIPDWRSNLTLFESDTRRDPLYREGWHELAKAHASAGDFGAARESLDQLLALGDAFRGYTSYLRMDDMLLLYCQLNLNLGKPGDSLRFFETVEPIPEQIAPYPALTLCGAQSLRLTGQSTRALSLLEALYALEIVGVRSQAAIEIATIHHAAGRNREARLWLGRVRASEIRDPTMSYRLIELRGRVGGSR